MPRVGKDLVEFTCTFYQFTNSTYCRMFVVPHITNNRTSVNIPSMIEVNDPQLIEKVKKLTKGKTLKLTIERKVGSTGLDLAAELSELTVLRAKKKKPKQS